MINRVDLTERILGQGRIKTDINEKADVVIVGSGCGGAVAAKELAERGLSVVVLEEGGYFSHKEHTQKLTDMFFKLYRDAGSTITLGYPPISMPLGKCIGGTAKINSGTCFRTPDHVLKKWEIVFGVEDCTPQKMLPYFERVEKICHVQELPREVWGSNAMVFKRGADRLGLNFKPLMHNFQDCKGCGTCVLGCPEGAKESPDVNYIPQAIASGARVYARARAEKILTRNGRAEGVTGKLLSIDGKKELARFSVKAPIVILAAGSFHTPALLQANKLANSSGQVGRNLTIHPASRVSAEFEERIEGWKGVPQGTYIDDFAQDGIMLEGVFVPPSLGAPMLPFIGLEHKALIKRFAHFGVYGAMISDTSVGMVKASGLKPNVFYQMNREDARKMRRAVAITARIFFAAGAKMVFTAIAGAASINYRDLETIETAKPNPADIETMGFHPLGTCRMGRRPEQSVVDHHQECHDVKGLFISDGSVFPSSLGVNPQITIMAFATKCAQYIADNAGEYL